jgi:hypothetical protein
MSIRSTSVTTFSIAVLVLGLSAATGTASVIRVEAFPSDGAVQEIVSCTSSDAGCADVISHEHLLRRPAARQRPLGCIWESTRFSSALGASKYVCAVRRGSVVLGAADFAVNGSGWGTAHPAEVYNGGDPSGLVTRIRWSHWGSGVATGWGMNAIFKPQGGYYPQLVHIELHASRLGRCSADGPLAYRHLAFRVPSQPGGPLGRWHSWSGQQSICTAPSY